MKTLRTSIAARNAMLNALASGASNGFVRIYGGEQPVTPEEQISTQPILAELDFGNPAFSAASGGVITANAIEDEDDALASGTATWFRIVGSNGIALWDGSVGESGTDMILDSVKIKAHARVSVISL